MGRLRAPHPLRMDDSTILLAYVAAESASLAAAFNALADEKATSRAGAYQAQATADNASWRWCQAMGLDIIDPTERIIAARQFLTENVEALEQMKDRLAL